MLVRFYVGVGVHLDVARMARAVPIGASAMNAYVLAETLYPQPPDERPLDAEEAQVLEAMLRQTFALAVKQTTDR